MSKKEVTIGKRPSARPDPDKWVAERQTEPLETEKNRRLTIDIPAYLHSRFKADCANQGVAMKDVILTYLHNKYPKEPY
jgi:hypothetical protein